MGEKVRIQFEFPPQAVKDLEEAKAELGFTSKVDVIRQAMGLLLWAIRARRKGWELIAVRGGEERAIVLPVAGLAEEEKTKELAPP